MTSDVREAARWILERHAHLGLVTEIRVLRNTEGGEKSIWAGIYGSDDLDALVTSLQPVSPTPRRRIPPNDHPRMGEANFYFTLNGVIPERAPGARRRLERARETVRDSDIGAYTLLPIDVDPIRPRCTSSTDQEKAAALEVADAIAAWLIERGAPPIRADSGNGYHLLVPLVPQMGQQLKTAAQDARTLLRLLNARFSTPRVQVDIGVFNPSRIFKLYGTRAVKGTNTQERPHRLASIELNHIPVEIDLFDHLRNELDAFAAQSGMRASRGQRTTAMSLTSAQTPAPPPVRLSPAMASLPSDPWRVWRREALAALPLGAVYGELLTGVCRRGWLECRDPASPSGDQNPSAGVADGSGVAERGTFHSFRTGESISVFDFLVQVGVVNDFRGACVRNGHELAGCGPS